MALWRAHVASMALRVTQVDALETIAIDRISETFRRGSTAIARERLNWREMTPSRRAGPGRSYRRMARIDWTSTPQERERKKTKKKQTQALFAADPEGNTNTIRLLGFLRLWRLSRLHETLVAAERTRTEEKAQEARTERERALRAEVERARLEGVAAESANARQRLEKMARAFKDEIDTLNEALVIAARDIAEAADSEIESENEREGGDVQEAYVRAPKDLRRAEPRPPKQKAPTRFVVDPSGAYEAKE